MVGQSFMFSIPLKRPATYGLARASRTPAKRQAYRASIQWIEFGADSMLPLSNGQCGLKLFAMDHSHSISGLDTRQVLDRNAESDGVRFELSESDGSTALVGFLDCQRLIIQ